MQHDKRKDVYISNLKLIHKHNAEHALGLRSTTLVANKFADLTSEEFLKSHTGYKPRSSRPSMPAEDIQPLGDVPESIDWREKVTSLIKKTLNYITISNDFDGEC